MLYRKLIALWFVLLATAANSQGLVVIGPDENAPIELNAGAGRLLQMTGPVASVFVADDETANIRVGSPGFLTLTGLSVGETTLFALDDQDNVLTALPVYVRHNIEAIRRVIDAVAPGHQVQAESVDRVVLLTGTVANQAEAARIVAAVTQILRSSFGGMTGISSDASAATSMGEVPLVSFITFAGSQEPNPVPLPSTIPSTLTCLGDATYEEGIRAVLSDTIPRATTVSVRVLDNSIILSGTVTSEDTRDRIMGIVNAMAGSRCAVVDGLTYSPQQISLNVRVVEMARNLSDRIGVSWGPLALRVGPNETSTMAPSVNAIDPIMMGGVNLDVMLEALTEQGLAATLAEPTLTARSGGKRQFSSRWGVPVPNLRRQRQCDNRIPRFWYRARILAYASGQRADCPRPEGRGQRPWRGHAGRKPFPHDASYRKRGRSCAGSKPGDCWVDVRNLGSECRRDSRTCAHPRSWGALSFKCVPAGANGTDRCRDAGNRLSQRTLY